MLDAAKGNDKTLKFINFQSFIDSHRISGLQTAIFFFCFLIAAIDGCDVALIGFLAPAISKALDIAPAKLAPVLAAGQFGAVAGALLIGPLADRFGRKRLMLLSTIAFGIMTAVSAYAPDLRSLVFLRFLTGVGLGGALPCATALTAEFCPERKRSTLTTAMFCGFTLGSAIGGFITAWAEPFLGWRQVMFWAGVIPLVLVPAIAFLVPESIEFLQRKGVAGPYLASIFSRIACGREGARIFVGRPERTKLSPVADLFSARPFKGILLLWVTSFMTLLVVYLLSS